MSYKKPAPSITLTLLLLTVFFILLQLSALVTFSPALQGLFKTALIPALKPGISQIGPLLRFIVIQVMLYGLMIAGIELIVRLNAVVWRWTGVQTWYASLIVWLIVIVTILLLNRVMFPLSVFSKLLAVLISAPVASILAGCLILILMLSTAGAWLGAWMKLQQQSPWWGYSWLVVTLGGIILWGVYQFKADRATNASIAAGSAKQPNVIMIGIDSLRPDYTGLGSGKPVPGQSLTPRLDHFLNDATVFTRAYTPLARTFPSWTSVLTGQYPKHNGARFDLFPKSQLNLKGSLPRLLKQNGYQTFFATDERRFSNISHHFGIQHPLGPKTGLYDFLLGSLNDWPLANLILHTSLGEWLFPYIANNRSAYVTYKPGQFNTYIEKRLKNEATSQPMFLAIHFCLPHWPYLWALGPRQHLQAKFPQTLYEQAVKRNDRQVAQFIKFLKQHHVLKHSIVVVLSDHGETLLQPDARVIHYDHYQPGDHSAANIMAQLNNLFGFNGYNYNTSFGHGTDVLSLNQYHIVLGIKTQGIKPRVYQGKVNQSVSTVDIKPTLLDLLNLKSHQPSDGRSLMPFLQGQLNQHWDRPLYLETGLTPSELRRNNTALPHSVGAIMQDYELHMNNMISLKPHAAYQLIRFKQRAVIQGHWLLALYPIHLPHVTTILVNLNNGLWTDDLQSALAQQAPVSQLIASLKQLYGAEITSYQPFKSLS